MERLIHLERVCKDYGPLRALDDVSLSLGRGVIGLLGPNGAGKTTLIKVLLGLVRVTRGSAEVLGRRLPGDARAVRSRVGYTPEDDCYVAGLSGVEMIRLAARLSGLPSVEALRRAHEILDFCGIEQERYRATETYSSGMRQKLKFAQSIVHDPPLLILDEPTSGLDPTERQSMLGRVRALARKAGKSVLVATHILPDVQAICDTVIVLAKGRVRVVESLEVLSRPQTPAYRVRILGPTDAFFAQLRREGVDVQSDSDGTLTLPRADSAVARRVWALAHQLGVGIRSFTAARNSLEDIFLEAIGEQSGADS